MSILLQEDGSALLQENGSDILLDEIILNSKFLRLVLSPSSNNLNINKTSQQNMNIKSNQLNINL